MKLTVKREDLNAERTIGRMAVDGVMQCWTLEDTVRTGPKVYGKTAIPAGSYVVMLTQSARFGRVLPLVCNVPGFEGIRIHPGNTAADTEGCILVGLGRAVDAVTGSRAAFDVLMAKLSAADSITLDIA